MDRIFPLSSRLLLRHGDVLHEAGEEVAKRVENAQTDGGDEDRHPQTLGGGEVPAIGAGKGEPQSVQHDIVGHIDEKCSRGWLYEVF